MDTALEGNNIAFSWAGRVGFNPHSNGYCSGSVFILASVGAHTPVSILILMDTALEVVGNSRYPASQLRFNPHSNGYCSGRLRWLLGSGCGRQVSILILMDTALEDCRRSEGIGSR